MAVTQTRLTTEEYNSLQRWLTHFGTGSRITSDMLNEGISDPDKPAPPNGRIRYQGLPAYNPLRLALERIIGSDHQGVYVEEAQRRLAEYFSEQYSGRPQVSPLNAAFSPPANVGLDPASADRLRRYNAVAAAVQQGKYDIPEIQALATSYFGIDPEKHGQLCFWLGLAHYHKGDLREAAEAFDEVRRGTRYHELAKFWLAWTAGQLSAGVDHDPVSTTNAVTRCDEFLSAYPQSSYRPQIEALRAKMIGVLAQSDRNVISFLADRANGAWHVQTTITPTSASAELVYRNYAQRQSDDNAVNYRTAAYQANPWYPDAKTNPEVLYRSAIAYHNNHRDAEANAVYQQLLQIDPAKAADVAEKLGSALGQTAAVPNTTSAEQLLGMIMAARDQGRQADAETMYHTLTQRYPGSYTIGQAARALGLNQMASAPPPQGNTPAVAMPASTPADALALYHEATANKSRAAYDQLEAHFKNWKGTQMAADYLKITRS